MGDRTVATEFTLSRKVRAPLGRPPGNSWADDMCTCIPSDGLVPQKTDRRTALVR
jgi:hypothetical protein